MPSTIGIVASHYTAAKTTITESFNKANGALGPDLSWTVINGSVVVESNTATSTNTNVSNEAVAQTALSTADHYSQMTTVLGFGGSGDNGWRILARATTSARTHYMFQVLPNNTYALYRRVSGSATLLASGSVTVATGKILRIEAEGSTIRGKFDGSQLCSVTDTNITGNKNCGIGFFPITSPYPSADNFEAGDL